MNGGVAVFVAPPGSEYAAVVAAVNLYNQRHKTSLFFPDVEPYCRVEWKDIELTAYGRSAETQIGAQLNAGQELVQLPIPDELACGCILGREQRECPHGNRREDWD